MFPMPAFFQPYLNLAKHFPNGPRKFNGPGYTAIIVGDKVTLTSTSGHTTYVTRVPENLSTRDIKKQLPEYIQALFKG